MLTRKLISGENEIADMFNRCSQVGMDVIELVWKEKRDYPARVIGFQHPIFKDKVRDSRKVDIDNLVEGIEYVVGQTMFYPDAAGLCWGYILDNKFNRQLLMENMKVGWYSIVDQRVRNEIKEEAKKLGIATEVVASDFNTVKKTTNEEKMEQALAQKEKEIQKLKDDLVKKEMERKPIAAALNVK